MTHFSCTSYLVEMPAIRLDYELLHCFPQLPKSLPWGLYLNDGTYYPTKNSHQFRAVYKDLDSSDCFSKTFEQGSCGMSGLLPPPLTFQCSPPPWAVCTACGRSCPWSRPGWWWLPTAGVGKPVGPGSPGTVPGTQWSASSPRGKSCRACGTGRVPVAARSRSASEEEHKEEWGWLYQIHTRFQVSFLQLY